MTSSGRTPGPADLPQSGEPSPVGEPTGEWVARGGSDGLPGAAGDPPGAGRASQGFPSYRRYGHSVLDGRTGLDAAVTEAGVGGGAPAERYLQMNGSAGVADPGPRNGHPVAAAGRGGAQPEPAAEYRPRDERASSPGLLRPPGEEPPTEVLRRYVPVDEVLDREARDARPAAAAVARTHPPRAVLRRRRARRRMLEWPVLIVFALLSALLIRTFAVQTFYIPSASMHETLREGDRVLVNKIGYHLHAVHRGDVVVFGRPPGFPIDEDDLIKRVVGLPGETVQAHDRRIYVDGRALREPYVDGACQGTEDFAPVRVPPGHLWVMGDNRCDSSDSRVFGPIDEHLVVGRAFVLVWPPGRLAWL